jgi:hypothetical protein
MIDPLKSSGVERAGNPANVYPLLSSQPRKAVVLRSPRYFPENDQPLPNSYLENLIQRNIIDKNHNDARGHIIAREIRALYNSLSETHQREFAEIVRAFEPEKEMLKGAIVSAGEIRVITETGSAMVINAMAELLGITYSKDNQNPTFSNFSGTSAGSFIAAGMAFRSPNTSFFRNSSDTKFSDFHYSPETIENWANKFLRKGLHLANGHFVHNVRVEHLAELGSNLQVLTGEWRRKIPPVMRTHLLPRDFEEHLGVNPGNIEIKKLIRATANLPFLFYSLGDLFGTCGDCFFEDKNGRKRYMFDPGFLEINMLPFHAMREDIQRYKEGKTDKPGLYFILANKKVGESDIPPTLFGKPTPKLFYWIYSRGVYIADLVDKYITGLAIDELRETGTDRGYLLAHCETTDPQTGKETKIGLGAFDMSPYDRETLICANIPTGDFKELKFESTIDQLHRKFVDPKFISSGGKAGKSAYRLYLDDVNKANGISTDDHVPLSGTGIEQAAAARLRIMGNE